jgi:hypothetical protein
VIRGLIAFLVAVLLGFLVASAHGQDKQTMKPADLKTPVIPAELRAEWYQALSNLQEAGLNENTAHAATVAAQEAMKPINEKVMQVCGDQWVPLRDKEGLRCVKKPEAPKPEVKK